MLRHELALDPQTWIASAKPVGALSARWPADGWVVLRHPHGHLARFRAARTRAFLEIAGEITEPRGWDTAAAHIHPEWYFHDHVGFMLDPGHDHATRRMLAVLRSGELRTEDSWQLPGEEVADVQRAGLKLPPLEAEVRVSETERGWRLRLRVRNDRLLDADGLAAEQGPIGFQVRFAPIGAVVHDAVCWPPADPFWRDSAFGYGDLLAPEAPLAVSGMDFGRPVWKTGEVTSRIRIRAAFRGRAVRHGLCRVCVQHTDGRRDLTTHAWQADGRQVRCSVPVDYPFGSKWAPNLRKIARVELELLDACGRELWHATYPFGFDAGIIVREPFGMLGRSAAGARRPDPADPAFVDKYRAWLLHSLPDWRWQTTRHGAPSDFFLRARRREDDVDLMRPTVLHDLALLIRRRFADWQDALCAASMLLHHPCMTVHSGSWSRIAGCADAASVLRLGGCFCGDTARVAGELAEEIGRLYHVPLRGYALGLRGHLSGLVSTPLGDVLVDPMLGIYYHTRDNRRLATLEELRTEAGLGERMWSLPHASDGAPFFFGVRNQPKRPLSRLPLCYPPPG
jgi:hypothetical protein